MHAQCDGGLLEVGPIHRDTLETAGARFAPRAAAASLIVSPARGDYRRTTSRLPPNLVPACGDLLCCRADCLGLAAARPAIVGGEGQRFRPPQSRDDHAHSSRRTGRAGGHARRPAHHPAALPAHHRPRHRGRRPGGQPAVRPAAAAVGRGPARRHQPVHQLARRLGQRGAGHLRHDAADPQRRQHAGHGPGRQHGASSCCAPGPRASGSACRTPRC